MQLLTVRPKSRGSVGLKSTNPFDLAKASIVAHMWGKSLPNMPATANVCSCSAWYWVMSRAHCV